MTLRDMLPAIDAGLPVWVNAGFGSEDPGNCEWFADRFESAGDIPAEYHPAQVDYITIDGEGELTIEIIMKWGATK